VHDDGGMMYRNALQYFNPSITKFYNRSSYQGDLSGCGNVSGHARYTTTINIVRLETTLSGANRK